MDIILLRSAIELLDMLMLFNPAKLACQSPFVTVNTFLEVITKNQRHNQRKYGLLCTHYRKSELFEARLQKYKI